MKVRSIKANQTELTLNDGKTVFVSYSTPVAAFIPGEGVIVTDKKWSSTTTRHINAWIKDNCPNATRKSVPQDTLDSLV